MAEVKVCLVRIKGRDGQRSHLIEKTSFSVGRAQDADLPILMPGVSRLHLRIELSGETVSITDQNSANGTFVNGKVIPKGQPHELMPGDVIRLGLEEAEFSFQSIPRPVEFTGGNAKSAAVVGSMDEIAKQMEAKARASVEQELRTAQLEAERILTQAKKDSENYKTQGLLELQTRKAELEAENARLQQQVRMSATSERLTAQKEADRMITDAQKQIQKDYDEASRQIEARLKDAQSRCFAMIEEADTRSRQVLEEAQNEAARLRREATEEARHVQSEALRKSQCSLSNLQEDFSREMNEKRAALKAEEARIAVERETFGTEMAKLREEAEAARKVLQEVAEIEARKEQAKEEYERYVRQKAEGVVKIDQELKEIRERQLLENESRKKQLEQEAAREKLKAIEDVKREIARVEQEYHQTMHVRALETSQRLQERLLPRLKDWLANPESASSEMKTAIEVAVKETMVAGTSSFQKVTVQEEGAPAPVQRKLRKVRLAFAGTAVVALASAALFHQDLLAYFQEHGTASYASEIVAQRKAESIYNPTQDNGYRDNYTDNVIYMRGYVETKTDPIYQEKWTLKLNDIGMLNDLGLNEEDIIKFIAKETAMVQRLSELRKNIDALHLDISLDEMRKAEQADLDEIKVILKNEKAFRQIRSLEKKSLEDFKSAQ